MSIFSDLNKPKYCIFKKNYHKSQNKSPPTLYLLVLFLSAVSVNVCGELCDSGDDSDDEDDGTDANSVAPGSAPWLSSSLPEPPPPPTPSWFSWELKYFPLICCCCWWWCCSLASDESW